MGSSSSTAAVPDPNAANRLCQLLSVPSPASIAAWDCIDRQLIVCRSVRDAWYRHVVAVDDSGGPLKADFLRRLLRQAPRLGRLTIRSEHHRIRRLPAALCIGSASLVFLDLSQQRVGDLRFLHRMPQLRQLLLKDVNVRDVKPIGTLQHLSVLFLSAKLPLDLTPLARCQALQKLFIAPATTIVNVAPLRRCQALKTLAIFDAPGLSDFAPIAELQQLRVLILFSVRCLRQLGWITSCTQLHTFLLARGGPCDIGPLARLPNLRTLVVKSTTLRNLLALRAAASLRIVSVLPITGAMVDTYYDLRHLRPDLSLQSIPFQITVACHFVDDDVVTLTASD